MKRHRFTNSTGILSVRDSNSGGLFKSHLEKCAFIDYLISPGTKLVRLQEPSISYTDAQGKKRRYTADLNVERRNEARPLVLEVKYQRELCRKPDLEQKFELIKAEFARRGIDFRVIVETEIHTSAFPMKRFVFDYINNSPHADEPKVLMVLRRHGMLRLEQVLFAVCGSSRVAQVQLAPAVWRLVATGKILVDFKENLDLAAKLQAPPAIEN